MNKKDVCIKTYTSIAEAELAKNVLGLAGIKAHILDTYPPNPLLETNYGIRLMVKSDDVQQAKELLDSVD
jgi:hypothetical protein